MSSLVTSKYLCVPCMALSHRGPWVVIFWLLLLLGKACIKPVSVSTQVQAYLDLYENRRELLWSICHCCSWMSPGLIWPSVTSCHQKQHWKQTRQFWHAAKTSDLFMGSLQHVITAQVFCPACFNLQCSQAAISSAGFSPAILSSPVVQASLVLIWWWSPWQAQQHK